MRCSRLAALSSVVFNYDRLLLLSSLMLSLLLYNVQVGQLYLIQYSLYSGPFEHLEVLFLPPLIPLEVPSWMSNLLVDLVDEQWVLTVSYPQWLPLTQESPLDLSNISEPWEAHLKIAPLWVCPIICLLDMHLIPLPFSPVSPSFFPLGLVAPFIACLKSCRSLTITSSGVIFGWVIYLCLKNTISVTIYDLVSTSQMFWHL